MPYIKQERRQQFEDTIDSLVDAMLRCNPGDLNYVLYASVKRYLDRVGLSYEQIRHVRAELRECHDEIGRRILVEYERSKMLENGDVS